LVSALKRRIERLEQSFGDDECPRCSGMVIVHGAGGGLSVTKDGHRFSPQAAERFYEEEQPHGICPRCDRKRRRVSVTWSPESRRNGPERR
jgi:Zn finger protein HypA/HybF involved in hydrogenase expression